MRHRSSPSIVVALALLVLAACARPAPSPAAATPPRLSLEPQNSGTTALLQAVSALSDRVAWVSGHEGTYVRTLDGGATWTPGRVPGADSLQFRDVHAVSADTAYLMSAGTGAVSRIYKTEDGGDSWRLLHTNPDSAGFYDCMAFWDDEGGFVYGDAVDGRLLVRATRDAGRTWSELPTGTLPAAQSGEGGFAASGTCAFAFTALGLDRAWIATGNGGQARVLRTTDRGRTWAVSTAPVVAGDAAGLAGIVFRDAHTGVAVGGEIGQPRRRGDYVALSRDGGATWHPGGRPLFAGAAYGVAYVPHATVPTVVMVGPGGANHSYDDGRSWLPLDTLAYWSVGFAHPRAGWAVGPRGRITKIRVE